MSGALDRLPSPGRMATLAEVHQRCAEAAGLGPRTVVRCRLCGHEETVDGATAMRFGWPRHCGQTMTLDPVKTDAAP